MPDRRCNGCTLCCTVTAVRELSKPVNQACVHCDGHGCSIYATRPEECANYACAWHQIPSLPESLRPDRCGVLFERVQRSRLIALLEDPVRPGAALTPEVQKVVQEFVRLNIAVVRKGPDGLVMYLPKYWTPTDVTTALDRAMQEGN